MKNLFTRDRLALMFSVTGILLMGVDLMMTRNFFVHVGELMVASLLCLVLGITIGRTPRARGEAAACRHTGGGDRP